MSHKNKYSQYLNDEMIPENIYREVTLYSPVLPASRNNFFYYMDPNYKHRMNTLDRKHNMPSHIEKILNTRIEYKWHRNGKENNVSTMFPSSIYIDKQPNYEFADKRLSIEFRENGEFKCIKIIINGVIKYLPSTIYSNGDQWWLKDNIRAIYINRVLFDRNTNKRNSEGERSSRLPSGITRDKIVYPTKEIKGLFWGLKK